MNHSILIKLVVAWVMVLSTAGLALAGSTASVTVSCVIPVMPGINAPLIEEDQLTSQSEAKAEQKITTPEEIPQENQALLKQETKKEELIATQEENPVRMVKTYYGR